MDKIILFALFFILSPLLWFFDKNIPFSDQKEIFDSLKSSASIIFAIIGAWLAVIYPKDLKLIFKTVNQQEIENTLIFKKLIWGLIIITSSLMAMIISLPIITLIKNITIFQEYKDILLKLFAIYILGLTLIQIYALLVTLVPNIKIMLDLRKQKEKKEIQDRNMPVGYTDKKKEK